MGRHDTSSAFARAMETADCETLTAQVVEWFDKAYRSTQNSVDIVVCLSSGMNAAYAKKIEECRRTWRDGEARQWELARRRFDAGMRAFVEAMAEQPDPDEPTGEMPARADKPPVPIGTGWQRPEVHKNGAGWGTPRTA